MRTTIDLPAELMRAAKVRAAERGENLKDLFTRAVAHEVGMQSRRPHRRGRVTLPLLGRGAAAEVTVTNADIEAALEDEDIDRYVNP
jgi:hypothetical protein